MFGKYFLFLTLSLASQSDEVLGHDTSVEYQDTVLFGCHGEYEKMLKKMEILETLFEKKYFMAEKADLKMDNILLKMNHLDLKMDTLNSKLEKFDDVHSETVPKNKEKENVVTPQKLANENEKLEEFQETVSEMTNLTSTLKNILELNRSNGEEPISLFKSLNKRFADDKENKISNLIKDGDSLEQLNMPLINEAARIWVAQNQAGQWRKVFAHNTSGGLFANLEDSKNKNPDNENSTLFSILDQLENFRDFQGNFQFKICYPELTFTPITPCNEWIQSSNPLYESNITGFKALRIAFPKTSAGASFGGLGLSPSSGLTLIDETPLKSSWYFAIGATQYWHKKDTIPGPPNSRGSDFAAIRKVELFVKTY
eukprot:GFUD01031946.1.p1 GENE.GFUD01031946.1~~GFUD01031946.1.p1  ORF type:complete len:379 (-),score=91.19 GFUD01031946.1:217-1326(-)